MERIKIVFKMKANLTAFAVRPPDAIKALLLGIIPGIAFVWGISKTLAEEVAIDEPLKLQKLHSEQQYIKTSQFSALQKDNSDEIEYGTLQDVDDYTPINHEPLDIKTIPLVAGSAALDDPENRIAPLFKVPSPLRPRVGFWFDVYTKYGQRQHIIHHTEYPWIVYDIVDTETFFKGPGSTWYKSAKAQKFVQSRKKKILAALNSLANRKSYRGLKGLEKKLFGILKRIRGSRTKVFKEASNTVRTQLGQRDFIVKGLRESTQFLPYMETIFAQKGLPLELTRIPFVESSFNTKAFSKVGASGIWQIMPIAAKGKLKITKDIDERNSPLKATKLSAQQLARDFRLLESWPLAITAYNHGIGSMRKAVKKLKTKNYVQILSRYTANSFGFASKNFYSSFLAALHAQMYHREVYGTMPMKAPILFDEYKLSRSLKPKKIIQLLGIKEDEFLSLNLDLRRSLLKNSALPKGFKIYLPEGHAHLLALNSKK